MSIEKKISATEMGRDEQESGDVLSLRASALTNEIDNESRARGEKALLRKIDLCLLPLLTVSYMLQFLDKTTLNFASIMGILTDLNLKGNEYSWASSAFYFGYLAASYPASFLMVRLPLGKYLAVTSMIWAIVLACHAATTNFTGLLIARLFLGVAEASISPGFSLMTGMWYKREEQPLRHGVWFCGNSVATMFGGLLGYGIAHIHGGLAAWRWLYIIFGLITFVWAVVLLIFLPDTPAQARFLTPEQRIQAVDRIRANQTGMKDNHFKWQHVWEAVTDLKIWLLVIFLFTFSIPNGAFTTFSSIVISGFGFSRFQTYLLNIPMGVVHGGFALGSTYLCGHFKGYRTTIAAGLSIISLVGSILVRYGPNQGARLSGVFIFVAYAAGIPISLSMVSSNVAGFTKKSVSTAMLFMAYTAGNIIGPFLFFPSQAPGYSSGFLGTAICFGIAAVSVFSLRFVLMYENRRRDEKSSEGVQSPEYDGLGLSDQTDKQNSKFRYVY